MCKMGSWYRQLYFGVKGYNQFTRKAFLEAQKTFKPLDENLDGKHVLITGGNSGIGLCSAIQLAKYGASVHIACRSKERGENAVKEILEKSNVDSSKVKLHLLDLSKSNDVHLFAKSFAQETKLFCLVNNAGCMLNTRAENSYGYEINFATNTLGMYILTKSFIESGVLAKDSRVVTVTSGGMYTQKLELDDVQFKKGTFDGTAAYAKHKRQQVVLADIWAEKFPEIYFCTVHPGWADTPAVQTSMPEFREKMLNNLRTPEEGSDCITSAVAGKKEDLGPSGSFYTDRAAVSKHLPLACTVESSSDRVKLVEIMESFFTETLTKTETLTRSF